MPERGGVASLAGGDKLLVFSESLEGALRVLLLRLLPQPNTVIEQHPTTTLLQAGMLHNGK